MQLAGFLYVSLLLPLLGHGNPVPYPQLILPTEEGYNSSTTNIPSKLIIARGLVETDVELDRHWLSRRGGARKTSKFIDITVEQQTKEFIINGTWYPMIELDCTNSYPTGKYKGDYFDICRNFLWIRNCDPSTDALIRKSGGVKGYPILHKGAIGSNSLRRTQGGYFDDADGPCSVKNLGAKTNTYHQEGKYSLEEMYMAFMEEGGLSIPEDAQIGETKLLREVVRSQSFRCVASSENKSAGSRLAGQVRDRGIQSRDSKGSKPPIGTHGNEYPPGAFIIGIVNYGAVTDNALYNWEQPTTCENDGYQFLGLRRPVRMNDMTAIMKKAKELKLSGEQGPKEFVATFRPKAPSKGKERWFLSPVSSVGKTTTSTMTWTSGGSAQIQPPAKGKLILPPPKPIPPENPPQLLQKGGGYSKVQEEPKAALNQIDSCPNFQGKHRQRGIPNETPKPNESCEMLPQDKAGDKAGRPETPPEKPTTEEPGAPIKPTSQLGFWGELESIDFKGWLDKESAWDKLDEDDGDTYDILFPMLEDLDKLLSPLKRGWQYFPAMSSGVADGKLKDLFNFAHPPDDSPSKHVKGKGKAKETGREVGAA